jgi:flagellum-specific peptidoglycan hydrolase FlgJ
MLDSHRTNNLELITQAAVASEKATGCPAELQVAQCILETGWLAHAPGNNCFGIKSYPGAFGRQLLFTREWFTDAECDRFLALGDGRTAEPAAPVQTDAHGRKLYKVQDHFATFATLGDCFARRAAMWDKGRYAPFATAYKTDKDLVRLVRGIAPIYATDPAYAESVLKLIGCDDVQAVLNRARAGAAQ